MKVPTLFPPNISNTFLGLFKLKITNRYASFLDMAIAPRSITPNFLSKPHHRKFS